ncbi:MAG: S24/S26 family peptidase [bacterium]
MAPDRAPAPPDMLREMARPYWLPVSGGSMYPRLRDGDLVHVVPFPADETRLPCPGDLILFLLDGLPVVHRYAGVARGLHIERADRSGQSRPFNPNDILGVVTARKRSNRVTTIGLPLRWRILREWLRITANFRRQP